MSHSVASAPDLSASKLIASASLVVDIAPISVNASIARTSQNTNPLKVSFSPFSRFSDCFLEQDYMRWKNLMKNSEKNTKRSIKNKLEYVFMPAGSLYSLMISKMNHQNENFQDEDCQG